MALTAEGERLKGLLSNPNVQKFLDAIKWSEGTLSPKYADPYTVANGAPGGVLASLDEPQFPEWAFKDKSGKANKSHAAGAYQWMPATWKEATARTGVTGFGREAQDINALQRIAQRGGLEAVLAGKYGDAFSAVRKEWASLPGAGYNQNERTLAQLEKVMGVPLRTQLASGPTGTESDRYVMNDGSLVAPGGAAQAKKLADVHASPFSDEVKRRMAKLTETMPKVTAVTDKQLIGDEYPKMFDDDIRRLIDTV